MTSNVAASVHQRLLNRAHATGRPFNELLQYFVLERFLYRLGHSPHARNFILKGALMFDVWQGPFARPTRDVDLLGHTENSVEHVVASIQAVCQEPVAEDDGLRFLTESISGERITEAAEYQGVRVHVEARLGPARIPVQIDVGFGDPLVPSSTLVRLSTLLDFPPPELQGYSRESAIAEKFQAMVYLGEINSRMKDFYDIWLLTKRMGLLTARSWRKRFAPPSSIGRPRSRPRRWRLHRRLQSAAINKRSGERLSAASMAAETTIRPAKSCRSWPKRSWRSPRSCPL